MELDWGTAVIGIIALVLCAMPFVLDYKSRIKKQKYFTLALNDLAKQQAAVIDQYEFCGNSVLGIYENRNFVFFYKEKKEVIISQFVNLSEVQNCYPIRKARAGKNNNETIIDYVELCFASKNKSNLETRFELFDSDFNSHLNGELQFAEKWSKQLLT